MPDAAIHLKCGSERMVYGTTEADLQPGVNPLMKRAMFSSPGGEGGLKCGLCPRYCVIPDGKTGFCGTRYNTSGSLWAINYGLISAIHMDPYEKKPLYHFHPGKHVLSLGSFGCNMACEHCQNCDISQRRITTLGGELNYHSPEDIMAMCRENVADGVSFTYNEPSIWLEYAIDCAKLLRAAKFSVSFVTNGYITEQGLNAIGHYLDAANVDIKGFKDRTYSEISKVDNPEQILARTEEMVKRWKMHVEITTNVIPGYNDTDATFRGISKWIASKLGVDIPWHLSRYHPAYRLMVPPTPMDTLVRARRIGREAGLKFIYLGNISDPEGDGTKCPACAKVVIERVGFATGKVNIKDGRCAHCGEPLNIKI